MKAVLFANKVADPVGSMTGIGRYVYHIVVELSRLVAEDVWSYDVCSPAEPSPPDWLPDESGYRRVPGNRKLLHLAWSGLGRPRLESLVGSFDLLHALHPSYPIHSRSPGVLTIHDLMPLKHPEWYGWDETWGFRRSLRAAVSQKWRLIADSHYVASQVSEACDIPEDEISVIHLGINPIFYGSSPPMFSAAICEKMQVVPGRFVIAIGHEAARKNITTVVRALSLVSDRSVKLVVVGRAGPGASEITRYAESMGLSDRVRFTGFVDDVELRALLTSAALLVHPAIDEGFGIPPLEAMSCGTPVAAARAGSLPEIVGDAAVLVDPLDVAEWATQIESLMGDQEARSQLVSKGMHRFRPFTWGRCAEETLKVYRAAIDMRGM